jgi:enoyl-[acyl-carrier protein] reductase I
VLVDGRRLLITGVLTEGSIAYAVARRAQQEGAQIVLTGFGRGMRITQRIANRLPEPPDVLELDINDPDHISAVVRDVETRWGALDGILHAIAFAPPDALGGRFLEAPADSAQTAFLTSAYSLKALVAPFVDLLERGEHGSIVGLDFDATIAWPAYDWMGVAKAALESVNRYLARDLGARGLRSNLVAAGPIKTIASGSIPGFEMLAAAWERQAPLPWDPRDAGPVADACLFLLSGLARGVTGEILHVDGGYHALGSPLAPPEDELAPSE